MRKGAARNRSAPSASARSRAARRLRMMLWSDRLFAYACLLPSVLLMTGIVALPMINVFIMSVSRTNPVGEPTAFAGLGNFRRLFGDPVFPQVMRQTLEWTISMVVVATPISVGLALALDQRFPGRSLARAIIFAPWAVSFVFVAVVWRYIFDPYYGHLNPLLILLTGQDIHIPWLGRPGTAMDSVVWVGITLTIPFTTIVTLAGLQSVPHEIIEAARIDGASSLQGFRYVTLPLLQPVLTIATLVNIIYIFNSFPIIWTMTEGGPANYTDTLVTLLYKRTFRFEDFGGGAALSVIGFTILMIFSLLYVRATAREVF
jgi:multiple sugar transport system permease protein